jgi:hypothetical protein
MKNWQKAGIVTLITLTIGGIYLFTVYEHRKNPGVATRGSQEPQLTPDDVAVVRAMFPTTFDDVVKLENTSVWMKNGYTMAYFPYQSGHILFTHPQGKIPSAQRLDIKKVIKASPPASVDDGISHGTRQAFAIFTMPGDAAEYATAIGAIDGSQQQYYSDVLFYYDDPHSIYSNWPKDVWTAIDAHQVKPGMSELETRMAIGQKTQSDSSSEGNRTVTYDQDGKQWTVTFVDNKATAVEAK